MWTQTTKILWTMAGFRLLSGSIELIAALLMLKFGKISTAFQINAALGLVGPTIFIIVSAFGVAGLAGKIPYSKMAYLAAGIALILYATRK